MKEILTFKECLTTKELHSLMFSVDDQKRVDLYLPPGKGKEYKKLKSKLIFVNK